MAALWGVPDVPATPGKTAIEMFQAAADGEIKALWIACTNPAQSLPDQATVRRALERAEFVVVQEAYASAATCDWADLLLPATTWGEKEGTVTNSERRISRVRAAVPAPAAPGFEAEGPRADWAIATELARRLEQRLPQRATHTLFPYASPEAVWNEHRETTRGRDLDITGLSYLQLEHAPQQWPCPQGEVKGCERLYSNGMYPTPDGKARFAALPFVPLAEERQSAYPYALTTGRLRDQWHGMTRTGSLGKLFGHVAEPEVLLHPSDLAELKLEAGDLVRVRSKRGEIVLPANPSHEIARRQAFIGMHWGSEYLGGRAVDGTPLAGVNALTTSAYCPRSKQPELKHSAVHIEKVDFPWTLQAMAWLPADRALAVQLALRPLLARFDYAACVPFASVGPALGAAAAEGDPPALCGVWFQAATQRPPEHGAAWLNTLSAALGLDSPDTLRYSDPPRHQYRRVRQQANGGQQIAAFLLAGDTRSSSWMSTLLRDALPSPASGLALLQPRSTLPGGGAIERSKPVCNCLGVSEQAIVQVLHRVNGNDGERLGQLQTQLKCGTQCGSCVPELKRLVRQTPATEAQTA